MVTNYQHKRIRRFAMFLGFALGLYLGMFLGQALTLRSIQKHGGCLAEHIELCNNGE
jgi:hypothetical protein